jgi:hypothetical protein
VTGGDPRGLGWDKGQGARNSTCFYPGSSAAAQRDTEPETRDEGRGTRDERRERHHVAETSPDGGDQGNQRSRTGVRGGHGHGHGHWRYDCAGQGHPRKLAASCRRLETLSTPAAPLVAPRRRFCARPTRCIRPCGCCSVVAPLAAGGTILVWLHPHPRPPSNPRPRCLQLTPTPTPTAWPAGTHPLQPTSLLSAHT